MVTTQGQAIASKYYKTKILKISNDADCRLFCIGIETIHHIDSICPMLTLKKYPVRDNAIPFHFHWNAYKHTYKHNPDLVTATSKKQYHGIGKWKKWCKKANFKKDKKKNTFIKYKDWR